MTVTSYRKWQGLRVKFLGSIFLLVDCNGTAHFLVTFSSDAYQLSSAFVFIACVAAPLYIEVAFVMRAGRDRPLEQEKKNVVFLFPQHVSCTLTDAALWELVICRLKGVAIRYFCTFDRHSVWWDGQLVSGAALLVIRLG